MILNKQNNKYNYLILGMLLFAALTVFAAAEDSADNPFGDCFYYFYGKDCGVNECEQTNTYINQLQDDFPELQLRKIEIYYNTENYQEFLAYMGAYQIPENSRGVPTVITANSYFIGEKPIRELLENHLEENNNSACPTPITKAVVGVIGQKVPPTVWEGLTFLTITKSAVENFTSAGSLALLASLLCLMVFLILWKNDRSKLLFKSLAFLLGAFLVYFVYGLGKLNWFGGASPAYWGYKVMGIIAVVFSGIMLLRYVLGKEDFLEKVAHRSKVAVEKNMNLIFCPLGVFALGILVGLFSLAGWHKTFGWIQYSIAGGKLLAGVMLFYYLMLFALLPLAVSWLVYWIREKGEEHNAGEKMWLWKKKELKVLKIVLSISSLVLGMLLLAGY